MIFYKFLQPDIYISLTNAKRILITIFVDCLCTKFIFWSQGLKH